MLSNGISFWVPAAQEWRTRMTTRCRSNESEALECLYVDQGWFTHLLFPTLGSASLSLYEVSEKTFFSLNIIYERNLLDLERANSIVRCIDVDWRSTARISDMALSASRKLCRPFCSRITFTATYTLYPDSLRIFSAKVGCGCNVLCGGWEGYKLMFLIALWL